MLKKITCATLSILVACGAAFADGQTPDQNSPGASTGRKRVMPRLDKRMPPVIPGQVVDVDGQKIKVWSTTGPVPVSTPPEPWRNFNNQPLSNNPGGIDVIVDGRRDSGINRNTAAPQAPQVEQ